jgi:hypothetical protein
VGSHRRWARVVIFSIGSVAAAALAGPVEVYREGARFCPRDRAANGVRLSQSEAIERARTMLPSDFCGPSLWVTGCDVIPEFALESWRIYFHQYRLHDMHHDWGGLTHTYVVLDQVGNCHANIPGTEPGAPR